MARTVDSLDKELSKHVVARCRVSEPYVEEDWGGKMHIQGVYMFTLDDGMEIEVCPFFTEGVQCIDYSIDKAIFDASGKGDFESYLRSIGLYTETVRNEDGDRWYYSLIDDEKCYRAQYGLVYSDF